MKGLFQVGGATSAFKSILVETSLRTSGSFEKAVEVANLTHSRCPVHTTLAKAVDMSFKLFVNGSDTPL